MKQRPIRVPTYEDKRRRRRLWGFATLFLMMIYVYCGVLENPVPFTRYTYCSGIPGHFMSEDQKYKQVEDAFFVAFDQELRSQKNFEVMRQKTKQLFEPAPKCAMETLSSFREDREFCKIESSDTANNFKLQWKVLITEPFFLSQTRYLSISLLGTGFPETRVDVELYEPGCSGAEFVAPD
jgi:hypothetical protein